MKRNAPDEEGWESPDPKRCRPNDFSEDSSKSVNRSEKSHTPDSRSEPQNIAEELDDLLSDKPLSTICGLKTAKEYIQDIRREARCKARELKRAQLSLEIDKLPQPSQSPTEGKGSAELKTERQRQPSQSPSSKPRTPSQVPTPSVTATSCSAEPSANMSRKALKTMDNIKPKMRVSKPVQPRRVVVKDARTRSSFYAYARREVTQRTGVGGGKVSKEAANEEKSQTKISQSLKPPTSSVSKQQVYKGDHEIRQPSTQRVTVKVEATNLKKRKAQDILNDGAQIRMVKKLKCKPPLALQLQARKNSQSSEEKGKADVQPRHFISNANQKTSSRQETSNTTPLVSTLQQTNASLIFVSRGSIVTPGGPPPLPASFMEVYNSIPVVDKENLDNLESSHQDKTQDPQLRADGGIHSGPAKHTSSNSSQGNRGTFAVDLPPPPSSPYPYNHNPRGKSSWELHREEELRKNRRRMEEEDRQERRRIQKGRDELRDAVKWLRRDDFPRSRHEREEDERERARLRRS